MWRLNGCEKGTGKERNATGKVCKRGGLNASYEKDPMITCGRHNNHYTCPAIAKGNRQLSLCYSTAISTCIAAAFDSLNARCWAKQPARLMCWAKAMTILVALVGQRQLSSSVSLLQGLQIRQLSPQSFHIHPSWQLSCCPVLVVPWASAIHFTGLADPKSFL